MKKKIVILALVLAITMSFFTIEVCAKENVLSNDKFYAEIPENFEISDAYGDDHYYLEDVVEYSGDLEIFVEGNILFPDGIRDTDIEVIKNRFSKFISVEESTEIEIKEAQKGNINGITACYISGSANDGISELFLHAYLLTTKENLYIITTLSYTDDSANEPEYLKEFISSFLINGTYYNGEKLNKPHNFLKAEKYIDALERDVLTEEYYNYNSGIESFAVILVFLAFAVPVVTIVFFVLYIKTKKKLKEYKDFFGSIEQAKIAMRQHYMQNNGGYYANVPNMNAYNSNQPPVSQPQYQSQYQPTQPAQSNIPPEMQDNQINNENKF